jgi:ABC-type dipeptide/oligopeptide/nickel transport system ATPase component
MAGTAGEHLTVAKKRMLYIVGEPGVGKTTAVRRTLRGVPAVQRQIPYVYITAYGPGVVQLGWDREGAFGGTDSLGMAAKPYVVQYLADEAPTMVLAEGDRLANMPFFQECVDLGYDITVLFMKCQPEELASRRERRNRRLGKSQNDRWLATRTSKVRNLEENLHRAGIVTLKQINVDDKSPTSIARLLVKEPVIKAIRRYRAG